MKWTIEELLTTLLLILFFTHLYIPILEPVQDSLFTGVSATETMTGQIVQAAVWALACSLMLRCYRRLMEGTIRLSFTALLVGCTLLSALWSQDSSITLRKSLFLTLTTAYGIYFARRFSIPQQLRLICVGGLTITSFSILLAVVFPQYGRDHDVHEGVWVGAFTQKNVCAREVLFILACLLAYNPATNVMRWCRRLAVASSLLLIAGTQSKTAYLMSLLVLGLTPALNLIRRSSRELMAAALFLALAVVALLIASMNSLLPYAVEVLGRDSTMTGRTEIWQAVMLAITKHPLLGYGFSAFWLSLKGESANIILALRWAVPAAHNGFLEVWLQLGAVGVLLFCTGFLQAARRAVSNFRTGADPYSHWPMSVLLLTIVYNLDESSLMQSNDFLWILYIVTLSNLACLDKPLRAPGHSPPLHLYRQEQALA